MEQPYKTYSYKQDGYGSFVVYSSGTDGFLCSSEKEAKKQVQIMNNRSKWEWLWERAMEAKSNENYPEAIRLLEEAVPLNKKCIFAIDELRIIYKKTKDVENEIRILKKGLEIRPQSPTYVKRLQKLEGTQPDMKVPTCRMKVVKDGQTWGDMFFEKWNSLTRDDFHLEKEEGYYDNEGNELDNVYRLCLNKGIEEEIGELVSFLYNNAWVKEAKLAELNNDYVKAAEIYEKIASEMLPYSDYYGHIAIYKKFRLREAELESILELQELCKKEDERYAVLTKRFAEWFPTSEFAYNYNEKEYCPSIGFQGFPPIRTRIYAETIRRIDWLKEKIAKGK